MIFVFVGDADFGEPPPLSHDLPPQLRAAGEDHYCAHLLNPNTTVRGIRRQGAANWRLAPRMVLIRGMSWYIRILPGCTPRTGLCHLVFDQ